MAQLGPNHGDELQNEAEAEPTQTPEGMTRRDYLRQLNAKYGEATFAPCVGCTGGVRIWSQGSDFCEKCIRDDMPSKWVD